MHKAIKQMVSCEMPNGNMPNAIYPQKPGSKDCLFERYRAGLCRLYTLESRGLSTLYFLEEPLLLRGLTSVLISWRLKRATRALSLQVLWAWHRQIVSIILIWWLGLWLICIHTLESVAQRNNYITNKWLLARSTRSGYHQVFSFRAKRK